MEIRPFLSNTVIGTAGSLHRNPGDGLAIGYFDYMHDPVKHLVRLRKDLSETGELAASFPKLYTARTLIRWVRLNLSGCPVYFYTESRVRSILREAGFSRIEIVNLSRDYIVLAD